ncbi:unnamed protein product, partial [Strongylus vulgaris]
TFAYESVLDSTKNPVPALLHKIEGHVARVNDVILLSKEEGVWTCSDDRSVRLYLKRDNGQFWPSIHKIMPVAPTCLYYSEETSRLLVGLLNGHVYEYHVADDYNSMSDPEARSSQKNPIACLPIKISVLFLGVITELNRWTIHAGPISGLGIALNAELVFSCSKDKSVVWHCSETGIKRGRNLFILMNIARLSKSIFYVSGAFHCDSSCTAMAIDLPFVFIGDHGGNVVVLRLSGDTAQMVSKLSAHTGCFAWIYIVCLCVKLTMEALFSGPVSSLAWNRVKEILYSGSHDNLVIMWDIGGKRGEAYELK